jgi:glutamate synthase domain-containing protein 1
MCGIAGFLSRTSTDGPVGAVLLDMLSGLGRRGPDSAGVAIVRGQPSPAEVCWIRAPHERSRSGAFERDIRSRLEAVAVVGSVDRRGDLLRVELDRTGDVRELSAAIERPTDEIEVVSLGRYLELVKEVGAPETLQRAYGVAAMRGSHGIGHTRLSTESRVDLSHSQPFWARGVPDLATVHNGHITNYHRLRRIYEQRGARFFTENDSEVIGIYLADQFSRGASLEQAIANSLDDLDGSFTYLVVTEKAIGYARDPFALKPLITVETDEYVAIANEEQAIRGALGPAGVAHEPSGHVYRIWLRSPAVVAAAA